MRGLENNHKFVYFGIISSQLKTLTLQYLIQNKPKTFQLSLPNFMGGAYWKRNKEMAPTADYQYDLSYSIESLGLFL